MKRREFLKSTALASGGALIGFRGKASGAEKPDIRKFKEIGRTGLKMSDISFGCGKLSSPALIARALDRGINYFDTAPDYGQSEKILGQAVKKIKKRDSMIIASKFCYSHPYPGHIPLGKPQKDYISAVEGSLKRLNTDYLDFCLVHAIGEAEGKGGVDRERKRLLDENMLSAVEKLKKAGKIRFLAVSSHGPTALEDLMLDAVNSGHYDMIQPAFNFMKFPKIPKLLQQAEKKGVGVIAMKTLAGAKDIGLDSEGDPFEHAAFKWVLKHKEVTGLIITIKNNRDLEYYVRASGQRFARSDQVILDEYKERYCASYCRTGCGECLGSCPEDLSIPTILRYRMYYEDYSMERQALEGYASLKKKADRCGACDEQECKGSCPFGLPVPELMKDSHTMLSFDMKNT